MILATGCFDGLHAGHVAYLQQAALLKDAEPFVVAVACDEYIRRHKRRDPQWSMNDRARTVAALRCVDDVVTHGANGAAQTIRDLRPRLFVKGRDWQAKGLAEDVILACLDVGCLMTFVSHDVQGHTSDAVRPQ